MSRTGATIVHLTRCAFCRHRPANGATPDGDAICGDCSANPYSSDDECTLDARRRA